jgi:hypothetical protein
VRQSLTCAWDVTARALDLKPARGQPDPDAVGKPVNNGAPKRPFIWPSRSTSGSDLVDPLTAFAFHALDLEPELTNS